MIVAFAVDPEALPLPGLDAGVRLAVHRRLLKRWRRQGVLVHPGPRLSESRLMAAIHALPVDLRKLWKETLTAAWRLPATALMEFSEVERAEDLRPLKDVVHLACLDETRALCVGLPPGQPCTRLPLIDVEICRLESVDATEAFERADALGEGWVEAGVRVADLWADRFARAARHARNVVVVDRYAAQNHVSTPTSGLRRLLVNLDGDARAANVRIYSQAPERNEVEAVERAVDSTIRELARGGVSEVRLLLVPFDSFEHLAHDRYVRFDDKVCSIGTGLEVLERDTVRRRASWHLVLHDRVTRTAEERLRDRASFERLWPVS